MITPPPYNPAVNNNLSSKCPSCDKKEKKKVVCAHCDYEYKDSDMTFLELVFGFLVIGLITAVIMYLGYTIFEFVYHQDKTLVQILIKQYNFILSLFKRIY